MNIRYFFKKNIYKIAGVGVLTLGIFSCRKFVQVGPPVTLLVTSSVFNNSTTATAALTTIYTQMANNGESFLMSQYSGLLSDEFKSYSTNSVNLQLYTNAMTATNTIGRWTTFYNYIYEANAVIAALQNKNNISPLIGQQLIGESKFIRAFWHFYLVNCYGDVPLVTTTDYTVNGNISRTPKAAVYQQIVADLMDAFHSLNSDYVDGTDTVITTERVRPTKWAAAALLARVYLYTNKYDSAEIFSNMLINNNVYKLCANLSGPDNSVFLVNSTEAIWQLSTPLPAGRNTSDATFFILKAAPGTGSGNSAAISPQLMNSFEVGDKRMTNWIGKTTTTPSYAYPFKYHANVASPITEYVMVLRLAEQYLIRAEARAQQGETSGAIADLDSIRVRAGLGIYTGGTDKASLLQAILHERQVELFTEWGHRWFDLIRTGAIDTVMGAPGNVYTFKGGIGSWNSTKELYPILSAQITIDPNLSQNPGY